MAKTRRKIEKTLRLVSPKMRGADVRALQWLLTGGEPSVWGKKHRKSPIVTLSKRSGRFDLATSIACKRAKYWLGYDTPDCTPDAGQKLFDLLMGAEPLPDTYKQRRDHRITEAKSPPRVKALQEARKHIGKGENPPGSNRTEFGRWYGWDGVPWCAIFLSYCAAKAGLRFRYASVLLAVLDAKAGRNGLHLVRNPEPGDLGVIGTDDHIFLVASKPNRWGNFQTVGGNESDAVRAGTRNRYRCSHFIRMDS